MGLLKPLITSTITLGILDMLFPNMTLSSLLVLVVAGALLTLVQTVIRPILSLLLLPLTVITLGFFSTVLNIGLLWLITAIVPGFHIDPMTVAGIHFNYFMTLVLFSFLISLVQSLIRKVW